MRLLLGIIVGAFLTVGSAYVYDSHDAQSASNTTASLRRLMVNWDVVNTKWDHLTERVRAEWTRLAG